MSYKWFSQLADQLSCLSKNTHYWCNRLTKRYLDNKATLTKDLEYQGNAYYNLYVMKSVKEESISEKETFTYYEFRGKGVLFLKFRKQRVTSSSWMTYKIHVNSEFSFEYCQTIFTEIIWPFDTYATFQWHYNYGLSLVTFKQNRLWSALVRLVYCKRQKWLSRYPNTAVLKSTYQEKQVFP